MLITFNNRVACTPFKDTAVKSKKMGSLQLLDTGAGGNLIALDVLIDSDIWPRQATWSERIKKGTKIYVKADCVQHAWSKSICFCDALMAEDAKVPFILVPAENIEMYEEPELEKDVP